MWKMQHAVDVKIDMIKRYLFAFAFENSNQRSMITEKLMHALPAGCNPVYGAINKQRLQYHGAPNVRDYLPHPDAAVVVSDFKDIGVFSRGTRYLTKIAKSETLVRKHTYWGRTKLALNFVAMLKTHQSLRNLRCSA